MLVSPVRRVIWPFCVAKSNNGESPVWKMCDICYMSLQDPDLHNTFVNVFIMHSASVEEAKWHERWEWHVDTRALSRKALTAATRTRRLNAWACPRPSRNPSEAERNLWLDLIFSFKRHRCISHNWFYLYFIDTNPAKRVDECCHQQLEASDRNSEA